VGTNVFVQVDPISFTMPAGGASPLPQILTIDNSLFNSPLSFFTAAATATSTSWLSVPACSNPSFPCSTPFPVTVNVVNASTLPAGTYTGEVIVYQDTNPAMSVSVPVTLNVVGSGAFFSNLPGQLSFTMKQSATKVTSQTLQIGNAGSGTLKFAITPSTSDGGAWLVVSLLSGTAPKTINVGVNPLNLPGAGKLAGTFVGQLLLVGGSDTETIPITVTVGNGAFSQLNPLNFVMPVGGANPLPQILTIPGINNAALHFYQITTTATGGKWLNAPACTNPSFPCTTPYPLGVGVTNASMLAAGTYTGQVTIYEDTNPAWSMTAPVTLTVVSTSKAFFDNLPGQTSFSLVPGSTSTPSQTIDLGNGGTGTLAWKIATNTADGPKWFTVTPTSGTNAGSYTVAVNVKGLPGGGKNAGTFIGQTVLETATGNVTIPVAVTVNSPVFVQTPLVKFTTKVGTNPAPQSVAIDSSGNAIGFFQVVATGKGGNWMSISTCGNPSFPCNTPTSLTVSVNSSSLAVGTYFADINIYQDSNPGESMTIPVVLTVTP
jgi:Viral BACON domain